MTLLGEKWKQSASRYAKQRAYVEKDLVLSYRELESRVDERARALSNHLENTGEPVFLSRQEPLSEVVDILSLLSLGRPYLCLGHDPPKQLPLRDKAGVRYLTTVVKPAQPDGVRPGRPIDDDPVLCLVSTSGTTDQPKLLARRHTAVWTNIQSYGESCRLGPNDRVALTASPARGTFLSQLLGGLLHGATIHPFALKQLGTEVFGRWLAESEISHLHLVPSVFEHTCRHLDERALPSLKTARFGGETLHRRQVEIFRSVAPGSRILNGYSASEAAGNICWHEIGAREIDEVVPVGRPGRGREIVIVDADGRPVQAGEIGRIVVRSSHLSDGYWNEPMLTESLFKKDGTEWWSDDAGYLDDYGLLFHCGRLDQTIKLLGQRVELNRCARELTKLEGVTKVQCEFSEGALLARIDTRADCLLPASAFRDRLNNLTATPLPWRLLFNGEEPAFEGTEHGSLFCRSLSELVQRPVSPGDNFFQLGGTSLLAAEWIQRLASLGIVVTPYQIASAPTIGALERLSEELGLSYLFRVEGTSPIFILPGGRGDATEFLEIAPALKGLSRSIIGLSPFPDGTESLDLMVEKSLALIGQATEIGKVILLGWCSGARLALEIGERLQQREVEVLLVDPPPPGPADETASAGRRWKGILRELGQSALRTRSHIRKLLTGSLRSRTRHANHLLRTANLVLRGRRWTPPQFDAEQYHKKRRAYSRLVKGGRWKHYKSKTTLLLTSDRKRSLAQWKTYLAGPMRVRTLPGNHDNFYLLHRADLIAQIDSAVTDEAD